MKQGHNRKKMVQINIPYRLPNYIRAIEPTQPLLQADAA
jgi:hypothetical protein